jgi:hypothetical protein
MLCFTEKSNLHDKKVRECSGIILEKETNKIIHYTFKKCYDSFSKELSLKEIKDWAETEVETEDTYPLDNIDGTEKVALFFEGCLIKLYHYNGEWNVSTSKTLDASKSFWSSKRSFLELFKDSVEESYNIEYNEFLKSLNENYCYSYLLQHPENRMAINVKEPTLFIVNKINMETLEEEIPELDNFIVKKTVSEIMNDYENLEITQNYLVYKIVDNVIVDRVKILNKKFLDLKKKCGNHPNIGLRYLECIADNDEKINIKNCFPANQRTFTEIDTKFHKTCKNIHDLYYKMYILKTKTEVPDKYKKTIYQMHSRYRQLRKPITLTDVSDKLVTLPARTLAGLIEFIY